MKKLQIFILALLFYSFAFSQNISEPRGRYVDIDGIYEYSYIFLTGGKGIYKYTYTTTGDCRETENFSFPITWKIEKDKLHISTGKLTYSYEHAGCKSNFSEGIFKKRGLNQQNLSIEYDFIFESSNTIWIDGFEFKRVSD